LDKTNSKAAVHRERKVGTTAGFRSIVEMSLDGIVVIDGRRVVRYVNPSAQAMLAQKSWGIKGKCVPVSMELGGVAELDITRKNREAGTAEMLVVEIEWEGETAYLALLRDITERKRAEQEMRRLDQLKTEFMGNISHELRRPLQSVLGFTKLILGGKVPDPEIQKEFLTIIGKQSTHLSRLIDNLLDVSRLESGRFQIQKQRMAVRQVIHEVVESLRILADEKGIALKEEVPETLPDVAGDEERLSQVMFNLLSNAIKFSNSGAVTVRAEAGYKELLVQVADQGIGIPDEAMPYIFERFYRHSPAGAGGAGLGLYISRQIVEAHGGRIWAESKLGQGSTFSLVLALE